MTALNVLGINAGQEKKYGLGWENAKQASITGSVKCVLDENFPQGTSSDDAWKTIRAAGGVDDSITYIVGVAKGGHQYVYVGKTLGTFSKRYPNKAEGGLKIALDFYDPRQSLTCVLYNVSHPALGEGWCYALLNEKDNTTVTNVHDPS
jgi:hypothetical protein